MFGMFARTTGRPCPTHPGEALPGRRERMPVPDAHGVNGHSLEPPFPEWTESALVGMGCFWGAERRVASAMPARRRAGGGAAR